MVRCRIVCRTERSVRNDLEIQLDFARKQLARRTGYLGTKMLADAIEGKRMGRAHAEPIVDQLETDMSAKPEREAFGSDSVGKTFPQVFNDFLFVPSHFLCHPSCAAPKPRLQAQPRSACGTGYR